MYLENFDSLLVCHFLCVPFDFDVKGEDDRVFGLMLQHDRGSHHVPLDNGADFDPGVGDLGRSQELQQGLQ